MCLRPARRETMPGAVILDTNALKHLARPDQRERVVTGLRAADLVFIPTALNVLEVVKTENEGVRPQLLATVRDLAAGHHLLPMPTRLLSQVGKAIVEKHDRFPLDASELEWVVEHPERITNTHVTGAARILRRNQEFWDKRHRDGRRAIRDLLRAKGVRDPWGDIATFLQVQWTIPSNLDTYIEKMWAGLKLPEPVPIDDVLANETWRLYFEGVGASIYERCVLAQQPRPVHVADLLHLVYVAGWNPRILVTDDGGLRRVASAILVGRY
jgi:hypothetical protein